MRHASSGARPCRCARVCLPREGIRPPILQKESHTEAGSPLNHAAAAYARVSGWQADGEAGPLAGGRLRSVEWGERAGGVAADQLEAWQMVQDGSMVFAFEAYAALASRLQPSTHADLSPDDVAAWKGAPLGTATPPHSCVLCPPHPARPANALPLRAAAAAQSQQVWLKLAEAQLVACGRVAARWFATPPPPLSVDERRVAAAELMMVAMDVEWAHQHRLRGGQPL